MLHPQHSAHILLLSPKLVPSSSQIVEKSLQKMETNNGEDTLITKRKGGFRACMFIFALTSLENMGFVANMITMGYYFFSVMNFNSAGSANTLTNFMGSTFLLSLVGGFISDTLLTRFTTALIFGMIEILALVLVTIQAATNSLHADACGKTSCVKGGAAVMLYVSLCLLALGAGGSKAAVPPLGADQFNPNDPIEAKSLPTYFNWLMLSTTIGAAFGVTFIVYVSTKVAWYKGFLIAAVATFVAFIIFISGKPFYRLQPPGDSPIIRVVQVIVVAFKNRKQSLPENPEELYEINEKERAAMEERLLHTNQFRWLDKAAIVSKDLKAAPWTVCTVTQVEEVKVLIRMLPILASTIIMNTCLAQLQTFSVQQGYLMDGHMGKFIVPPPSIPVIPILFMSFLLPIYEYAFVPFARKITKHPSGITQLQRVGVGLVLSAISMAVAGVIEVKRRNQFFKNPFKPISLFWLSFQYGIFGIADMFTLVGLLEFFYREAPAGMRSLSTAFTWLSLSLGYFLSSAIVSIINAVTKKVTPSKQGWLHGLNINENKLNLFYWFLAILSVLNFALYVVAASWYRYKPEDHSEHAHESILTVPPEELILTKQEEKKDEDGGEKAKRDHEEAATTENDKGEKAKGEHEEAATTENDKGEKAKGDHEEAATTENDEGEKENADHEEAATTGNDKEKANN